MSAATTDRATDSRPGALLSVGVSATAVLLLGVLACYGADGYLVDGTDTSGLVFAGVTSEDGDNTDGADGDINVAVYTKGQFRFASSGLLITDVGAKLYLVDNQTVGLVDDAAVDNHVYVGRLAEYISANECWVEIEPANLEDVRQFTVAVAGTNAAALTTVLNAAAAAFGGAGFYVTAVQSMEAYNTGTKASAGMKVVTTNYTLASGVLTTVTDESANTLIITFTGRLS